MFLNLGIACLLLMLHAEKRNVQEIASLLTHIYTVLNGTTTCVLRHMLGYKELIWFLLNSILFLQREWPN